MNKEIWYGVQNNDVRFAETKDALTDAGISNPQHFTINGSVQGLNLVGGGNTAQGGQASTQTA